MMGKEIIVGQLIEKQIIMTISKAMIMYIDIIVGEHSMQFQKKFLRSRKIYLGDA